MVSSCSCAICSYESKVSESGSGIDGTDNGHDDTDHEFEQRSFLVQVVLRLLPVLLILLVVLVVGLLVVRDEIMAEILAGIYPESESKGRGRKKWGDAKPRALQDR
eukprot:2297680-Rhodomonas_salina.1